MGVLDFLMEWDIATIILAAAVLTVVVLVASYGLALAWRKNKERKRARPRGPRAAQPAATGPTGVGFTKRSVTTKQPKALPKPSLRKLKKE